MRAYLQRSIEAALRKLFPADDAETALSWWIASEGRSPVVIVGAGFTRNARDRSTGHRVSSAHVPLWADVLRRFGEDLGSSLEGIDALTIAELHAEALGFRRHVDLLLEMLPDDRLAPGLAHEALFDLRPAAIVTTNFLDTVLDRHPRAVAIFDDPSAAARVDFREHTEVIYLHGHRSVPATWVLTRSQFDNLEDSRPVLLTRVRQLFAQHPILTVGYGLADPDFHQVQGQIHARMAGYQPLGLTLLGPLDSNDRGSRTESALRGHWEKRHLRIVRFKDGADLGANLSQFLRLPGKMAVSECEKLLRGERSFHKRVELARSILQDADAEKRIEAEYGWQERIWRTCLDADLLDAERAVIRSRCSAPVQSSVAHPETSSAPEHPRFSTLLLNNRPAYARWELASLCDCWWESNRDKVALLDWLHERVLHRDWPMRGAGGDMDTRIAELLILLIESLPPDAKSPQTRRAAEAMRLLRRYDPETAARLVETFESLGEHIEHERSAPLDESERKMAEGFRASMDGDHLRAADAYHRAFELAQRAPEPLAVWLAARSRRLAHDVGRDPLGDVDDDRERITHRYIAEEREAAGHPRVVEWRNAAKQRVLALRELTVKDLQEGSQRRAFEGTYVRIGNELHLAWRTLRDLEEAGAHPGLQLQYVRPLLDHGFGDIATEVPYLLIFDAERFHDWSRIVLEQNFLDLNAYNQRAHQLFSAWLSLATNAPSISAFVGCLKGIASLSPFVQKGDVDKIRDVLVDAPKVLAAGSHDEKFGSGAVRTFNGSVNANTILARAWSEWLTLRGLVEDVALFKGWADTLEPWDLFDHRDGVHCVQWEFMIHAGVPVDSIIAWLCGPERLEWLRASNATRYRTPFAILLWRLAATQPQTVSADEWQTLSEVLTSLLPDSTEAMIGGYGLPQGDDLLRAGFGLLAAWGRGEHRLGSPKDAPIGLRVLRERLERLATSFFHLPAGEGHAAVILAQLAVATAALRVDQRIMAPEIDALAEKLDIDWVRIFRFCKNNHRYASCPVHFLAETSGSKLAALSLGAQQKILDLVELSSSALDGLPKILDPKLWAAETRPQLVQLLREAAGGARGRFPASSRLDICDLVSDIVVHTRQPLPPDLGFLASNVLSLAAHEHATVANHAAYAVAALAKWGTSLADTALAEDTARTLCTIAKDSRPEVRSAAAYSLGFLANSPHAPLRELAGPLAGLASDPYQQVHAAWRRGQRSIDADAAG